MYVRNVGGFIVGTAVRAREGPSVNIVLEAPGAADSYIYMMQFPFLGLALLLSRKAEHYLSLSLPSLWRNMVMAWSFLYISDNSVWINSVEKREV